MIKTCPHCLETKSLSHYYLDSKGKPRNRYCKVCWTSVMKEKRQAQAAAKRAVTATRTSKVCYICEQNLPLGKFNSRQREGRTDYDSYCIECRSHDARRRRYGVTAEQYKTMYEEQGGCCLICGEACTTLVVDHCHSQGTIRGLLCRHCNTALGLLGEDPDRMMAAAAYVLAGQNVLELR